MGYRLTGSKLAYCADHIVTYRKMNNGRRLRVVCDSKDAGEQVHAYLRSVYNSKSYDKGWDWEDFTMVFSDTWHRDDAFADMDAAITEYREVHPSGSGTGNGYDPSNTETPEKDSTDWTTYIIIGLAAVAILQLIFGKMKKG